MANRKPSQSWDNLRYFLAVARTGTLSAAAEQLGTEHTTVARHIRALEEELNSRLFHRSNSGYGLTEVGERLFAGGEAVESAYASAKAAANNEGQTIGGTVRIGTPDGFGSLFLAPRVRVLTDRHPKLEIEILTTARRQFSLLKREADIAIGLSGPEHMRLVSRRLTDYRLYVYGSRAYLEKAAPIVTVQDLKNHPFIGYVEELLFSPELSFAEAIGADIDPRIRGTSVLSQLHATLSGSGLCVLPAFVASSYPTLVPILPEKVSVLLSYHMHIHEDDRRAAHVREVAAFIAAEVERDRSLFLRQRHHRGASRENMRKSRRL